MRKLAISAAAVLSALALAIMLWRIEPLLPERGGTTCFAAEYSPPRPIDLSSPRRDQKSVGDVKSMRVEIWLSPDERPFRGERAGRSYDWRYSLRLQARLTDASLLSTGAICEWSDTFVDRLMPVLSCYIDCDGGSVSVFRNIGQNALSVRFEAGERLRTGQSCDGGGSVFIGAEREARSLPVEQLSRQKCTE
ncbi:hypothetical protein [Bradyrhizobium sp.]|uniref:hypothetical protein n=1 Tax=Bradyrhizobium sp. TaxID=376 RepID=UPI001DF8BDCC|nr:hypothetical protein [Bradyrhizobium sp.]MBI5321565.1 hypothetical protein [Bradyrhizobium sp.]